MGVRGELNVEDWIYGVMEDRREPTERREEGIEERGEGSGPHVGRNRMRARQRVGGGRDAGDGDEGYSHETRIAGGRERRVAVTYV